MKRICCTGALIFSLLLGAARTADLILNTDAETGFLRSGGILPRYLLLLACVLLILLAGRSVPLGQSCGLRPKDAAWMRGGNFLLVPLAFCCELYGFSFLLNRLPGAPIQTTARRHAMDNMLLYDMEQFMNGARAALLVLFGIWCLLLFFENLAHILCGKWMPRLGMLSILAFYLHAILHFLGLSSGLYRIVPVVDMLSVLSALLFAIAFSRTLYLPDSPYAARVLCRDGLLAFFFCTCLALPQAVWTYAKGTEPLSTLILSAGIGCLGLVGAFCAVRAANGGKTPEEA